MLMLPTKLQKTPKNTPFHPLFLTLALKNSEKLMVKLAFLAFLAELAELA